MFLIDCYSLLQLCGWFLIIVIFRVFCKFFLKRERERDIEEDSKFVLYIFIFFNKIKNE